MDKTENSGVYALHQMPESHKSFKRVALICSDGDFAEDLLRLPIGVKWKTFSSSDEDFSIAVLQYDPDLVVVCSNGGTLTSGPRVCEAIKRRINVPLVFINRGQYPDSFDFSPFADVDVKEPRDLRDLLNLGIEIVRLAYDVPTPSVQVGLATATRRSTTKWILTVGAAIALLSGGITLIFQTDVEAALKAAVTTFSAITSVEIGTLVKYRLRRHSQRRSG